MSPPDTRHQAPFLGRSDTTLYAGFERLVDTFGRPVAFDAVDLSNVTPAALGAARSFWRGRAREEHRSALIFSELVGQLRAAEAPLDIEGMCMRYALDELRHAALCQRLLVLLGVDPLQVGRLPSQSLPEHGESTPRARALRNVVYTSCMSETLATANMLATRDRAADPVVKSVIEALLADEVQHGRFGWEVLKAFAPLSEEERASLERFLAVAFAHWKAQVWARAPLEPPVPEGAEQLGVPRFSELRGLFVDVVEEAVIPGLEAHGVGARKAWRESGAGG